MTDNKIATTQMPNEGHENVKPYIPESPSLLQHADNDALDFVQEAELAVMARG